MPISRKKILTLFFLSALAASFFAVFYGAAAQNNNQTYGDSDVPMILPRSAWDNTPTLNALMTWPPSANETPSDWQPVERIIIHHSATPTDDSISAVSRIQSIYRFHAVTQGWGDIGYNYIIDQQGRIYEGRIGGNGSRGAHVFRDQNGGDNFNYGSIGIVLLGDYSTRDASQTMYNSLERLVGWLAAANNLDPQKIAATAVWNKNRQTFSSYFSGYAVLGHKDIDNTNCPGAVNLAKIRQNAAVFKQKFSNYIYQTDGSGRLYAIKNGTRKAYAGLTDYAAAGNTYDKIVSISQTQLDLFSETRFLKYPDGTLLRINNEPTVYLVDGGKKRAFQITAPQFAKLGFNFDLVKIITADEISNYQDGPAIKYGVDKELLSDGVKVYLMGDGRKHWITSGELFNKLGLKWSKIKTVGSAELAYYIQGEAVKYPEGKLIRPANENNVYLIADNSPQPIDAATFKARKYKWPQVLVVSPADFNALYRPSSVLPTPTPSPNSSPSPSPSATPSPSTSPSAAAPKIRIAIYEVTTPSITLTANTAYNVLNKSGQIIAAKNANENYVYAYGAPSDAYIKISPATAGGIAQIVSYEDHPAWRPSLNYNQFRGSVEIIYSAKSNKVWAINELNLEDYLKGIAEINDSDPIEHQKTMIVAARTYAYYYLQKGGKRGASEVYILNNTSSDQLYKGYVRETIAPAVVSAVAATSGEMAVYNNQPIITAYSSGAPELAISGTKSACSVWGDSGNAFCQPGFEYLVGGVKDPANAPYTQTACGGGNHCVGLSAAGSRQFALTKAKNYQEILKHYYIGTEVKKIY